MFDFAKPRQQGSVSLGWPLLNPAFLPGNRSLLAVVAML